MIKIMNELYSELQFFECKFCKDVWEDKTEMIEHSEKCIYNPEYKACGTCKHLRQYEVVEGFPYIHCEKNNSSVLENANGKGLYDIYKECWELADLEQPIEKLTEEEAELLRETQDHSKTVFVKSIKDLEN